MKLKTLAIAITAAAMPFAAQAELKITGDIGVAYQQSGAGVKSFGESGSELNIDASETVNGVTYYGHTEVDMGGTGNTANFDEIRVGMKGGFGELILGEADNACDQLDVGGTNEVWVTHAQGGCQGSDVNNIVYKRKMGAATVSLSHNPENSEHSAFGIKGGVGPVTASFGYEDGDGLGGNNITYGVVGKIGSFSVGLRGNTFSSDTAGADTDGIGANFLWSRSGHSVYGGFGQVDAYTAAVGANTVVDTTASTGPIRDASNNIIGYTTPAYVAASAASTATNDSWSLGYKRTIGSTDFIAEMADYENENDSRYAIGVRHRF